MTWTVGHIVEGIRRVGKEPPRHLLTFDQSAPFTMAMAIDYIEPNRVCRIEVERCSVCCGSWFVRFAERTNDPAQFLSSWIVSTGPGGNVEMGVDV